MDRTEILGLKKLLATLLKIYLVALFIILGTVIAVTFSYKNEIAKTLVLTTKTSLMVRDMRQAIVNIENVAGTQFKAVVFSDQNGTEIFNTTKDRNKSNSSFFFDPNSILVFPLYEDELKTKSFGTLKLTFSSLEYAPYAVIIWLLFLIASVPLIQKSKSNIIDQHKLELHKQRLEALDVVARQVAHDIRSPLAALNSIASVEFGIDEKNRLQIRAVVNRIRDVANELLSKQKAHNYENDFSNKSEHISPPQPLEDESKRAELVASLIMTVASEKRLRHRDNPSVKITVDSKLETFLFFSIINRGEFFRILSNLIDNGIESFVNEGVISISVHDADTTIQIFIKDNGRGIPEDILPKVGTPGFSWGKHGQLESGTGLGVNHAIRTARNWNGSLSYASKVGVGTNVVLEIPKAAPPKWFTAQISISKSSTIVILDDDRTIHRLWESKFITHGILRSNLLFFDNSGDLIDWYRMSSGDIKNPTYLFDQRLKALDTSGLDLAQRLGIEKNAILVTSEWDDPKVQLQSERLGIKTLPKHLIGVCKIKEIEES